MMSLDFSRYALCSCVAAAMLASCGGLQSPIGTPRAMPQGAARATLVVTRSRTFNYTGKKQSFVVPAGVTQITIVARGGGGASCPRTGRGARVYAEIPVTPKDRFEIRVGGAGNGPKGGFNGGGDSSNEFGGGGVPAVI